MSIYTVANWFTCLAEAYCMFIMSEALFKRRENIKKYFYYGSIVAGGCLIQVSNMLFANGLLNLAGFAIVFLGITIVYKGALGKRILASLSVVVIASFTEVITLYLMSFIFDTSADVIAEDGVLRLFGIVISKLLGYAVIKVITMKLKPEFTEHEVSYWVLFAVMFAITTVTIFTFWKMLAEDVSDYIRNLAGMSTVGIGVATVIVMVLFENSVKQQSIIGMKQISEVRLKEQLRHYDDIVMSQRQVKKTVHDLNNHLFAIKAMTEAGESDECIGYIDNLLNNVNVESGYIDTGNTVLDAIISAKHSEAQRVGVEFNTVVMIPANLPISPEDECVIFGNAIDNAIEAAAKVSDKGYVNVYMVLDRETLVCKIINSCVNDTDRITSKSDVKNHGIGKSNIKEALGKYNCISRVTKEDGEYILSIIFMGLYKNRD